jgi:hypothetical protein
MQEQRSIRASGQMSHLGTLLHISDARSIPLELDEVVAAYLRLAPRPGLPRSLLVLHRHRHVKATDCCVLSGHPSEWNLLARPAISIHTTS